MKHYVTLESPSFERFQYPNDMSKWTDQDVLDEIEVATYFWAACLLENHLPVSGEQLIEAQGVWENRLRIAEKEAASRGITAQSDSTIPTEG
jgi:hypothetical protein